MGNNVNTAKCILRIHRLCSTDSGNNPRNQTVFLTISKIFLYMMQVELFFCETVIVINTFTLYKRSLVQEKTAAEMVTF